MGLDLIGGKASKTASMSAKGTQAGWLGWGHGCGAIVAVAGVALAEEGPGDDRLSMSALRQRFTDSRSVRGTNWEVQ